MRTSKVIRKAIPYVVVAVVAYFIYTAHANEGFGESNGGGGNNDCTQGKVKTCVAPYYLKDGNRCVKDVSGGKVPVWVNPTCDCKLGKTVKCPSSKPKLRSSDKKCFATTAYTGSSVEQSCN